MKSKENIIIIIIICIKKQPELVGAEEVICI